MKQLISKPIDTTVFGESYNPDLSLGKLFVTYFNSLFSSIVINNLDIEAHKFLDALEQEGYNVQVLSTFKTVHHPTKEGTLNHQLNPNDRVIEHMEIILFVEPEILVGIKPESFRICYNNKASEEKITEIIDIYSNLNKEN